LRFGIQAASPFVGINPRGEALTSGAKEKSPESVATA
jgi:hypothetical protein